VSFCGGSA
jgi:drug/metabolite transporter (DMT)-like permease